MKSITNILERRETINSSEKISIENFLLLIYFFFVAFEEMLNFGQGTLLKYVAFVYCVFAGIKIYRNNMKIRFGDPIILCSVLLMTVSISSVLWSIDQLLSFNRISNYLLLQTFFLITYTNNCNSKEFALIEKGIVAGGVFLCIFILVFNQDILYSDLGRATVVEGGGPNGLAAFLVLPLFIILGTVIKSGSFVKNFYALWVILLSYILLMTGSRGAFVGAILGIFVLFYKRFNRIRVAQFAWLLFFLIISYFVIIQLPETIMVRYFTIDSFTSDYTRDDLTRTNIWIYFIDWVIPASPLLGYGAGTAPLALSNTVSDYYMGTHNTYLNMIVEYGIIGLPIFLFFLLNIYKNIIQQKNPTKMAVFLCILVVIFFLDSFPMKAFWNVLIYSTLGYKRNST